jgi:hypothetical protein
MSGVPGDEPTGPGSGPARPGGEPATPITLDDARQRLARLRPRIEEFVQRRADLAELRVDLAAGGDSPLGGVAERKGQEAHLHAELEVLAAQGAQVKGIAPLLLDWPGERDGVPVLWCWLEGEPDIGWYHRADLGFAGRRPL